MTEALLFFPGLILTLFMFGAIVVAVIKANNRGNETIRLKKSGVKTAGIVTHVHSNRGENAAVINITLRAKYIHQNTHREHEGEGNAAVDVTKLAQYQPGEEIELIYNDEAPHRIFPVVPEPSTWLKR